MTEQSLSSRIGCQIAKIFHVDLEDETAEYERRVARGESAYARVPVADYIEPDPTIAEWFAQYWPTNEEVSQYVLGFFPFATWIGRYNWRWAYGDLIAGITVGCVVIPQGMAYSKLALLPPEFGLYSSFVGVMLYWFFATSKDITIGPVAVMSTLVGNIVSDLPSRERPATASALALIAGCIVFSMGILRLGFVVDYIPLTAIAAFMTGSALNIAAGQTPAMLGIDKHLNTRDATYLVFINTLKNLDKCTIDAAMGLTALFLLYLLRWVFTNQLVARHPRWQRTWFFINTLRTVCVILLYTMISWLVNRHRRDDPLFAILRKVPRGFRHIGVPKVNGVIISHFAPNLPAAVTVLLIEHIAISKSFGRVNNYTIDPSQELVAIGITNIIGPFFGAYPATGSFSRTAIKAKAGVRTPFAGVVTGIVVLLAIYCLTTVFFYIPDATLSAVIIHAVLDLITKPNTVYKFWRVSPIEAVVFFVGVVVTIFTSIENGIYITVVVSGAIVLFRIAKAKGHFLGQVRAHSVIGDHFISAGSSRSNSDVTLVANVNRRSSSIPIGTFPTTYGTSGGLMRCKSSRNVFVPLDHQDGTNPLVDVLSPYPGVFVYRFSEGFFYANAAHYTEHLVAYIFNHTRRGLPGITLKPGDRPWNEASPSPKRARRGDELHDDDLPTLKAVILDFSSVNNVDITSVQNLLDTRNQLDRYAAPEVVEWHFACIRNRWTKRALASVGFGCPRSWKEDREDYKPVFSVAEVVAVDDETGLMDWEKEMMEDPETLRSLTRLERKVAPIQGVGRPFFHVDLEGAVQNAVRCAQREGEWST